jgi:hypothetical protein
LALDVRIAEIDQRPAPVPPEAYDPSGIEGRIAALELRIGKIDDQVEPEPVAALPVPEVAPQPAPEVVVEDVPTGEAASPQVIVLAASEAWVQVRDGRRKIFEGTLPAGGQFTLPEKMGEPLLRAGNARAVYVLMRGVAYGPVGGSRRVVKNFLLNAENIESRLPPANADDPEGRAARVAALEAMGVESTNLPLTPDPAVVGVQTEAPAGLGMPSAPVLPVLDLPGMTLPETVQAGPIVLPDEPAPAGSGKVIIHAVDAAWIRVRDGSRVIFEGTLPVGGQFELPVEMDKPLLRAGNAGSVYVLVGDVAYGPMGRSSRMVKNIFLRPTDIETRFPKADGVVPGK